jgi:hypothetical protein
MKEPEFSMGSAVVAQEMTDGTNTLSASRNPDAYLNQIWQEYFFDIPCVNEVQIAYCYPWKNRLGMIRLSVDNATSFIGINALLQHLLVPECVLITTIAHELTHYAHGFGSPLPRPYVHPHANNVVNQELERRGLGEFIHQSEAWIDKQWFTFYDNERRSGWAGIPGSYRSTRHRQKSEC